MLTCYTQHIISNLIIRENRRAENNIAMLKSVSKYVHFQSKKKKDPLERLTLWDKIPLRCSPRASFDFIGDLLQKTLEVVELGGEKELVLRSMCRL